MAKEIGEEYLSSLADLNVNSKPLINMLTIIAEENIEHAEVIVKAVEQHLAKVNPDVKLPVLYLIDSIVKNVGRDYKALFSRYIVNIFCGVFEKVNEKVREKMFALRQTWNEVFSQQKLYTLDVKINCMDPGWPITAKVKSPAIHLNPNFLKNKVGTGDPKLTEMAKLSEMQSQLRDKERELQELQKHKLQLELVATQKKIEEEEQKLNMQMTSLQMAIPPPVIGPPGVRPPVVRGFMPRPGTFPSVVPHMGAPVTATASMSPFASMPAPMMGKTRVAPVNPALVSSVQLRDPRLVRQMQQQMARMAEAQPPVRPMITPSGSKGGRKVVTNKENKSRSSSSSSHSGKSSKSSSGKSTSTSPKSKEKSTSLSSSKERSRRDSSSSSSSGKGGKSGRRSHSSDRSGKGEKKEQHSEKSPKRSGKEEQQQQQEQDVNTATPTIFRDMRLAPGTRSFLKQPARSNKSPTPPQGSDGASEVPVADVDMRIVAAAAEQEKVVTSGVGGEKNDLQQPEKVSSENAEKSKREIQLQFCSLLLYNFLRTTELLLLIFPFSFYLYIYFYAKQQDDSFAEQFVDASIADVDLRQFPSGVNEATGAASAEEATKASEEPTSGKKRAIDEPEDSNVASKKSKSDKLDVLFGSQDVDLRTLGAIKAASSAEQLTPPPPPIISHETESNWAKLKGDTPKKQSQLKASLAAIRAKLAEATKPKRPMTQITEILERKRKLPGKFANAAPTEVAEVIGKVELSEDPSSQDANDASIKIIVAQAQEQLDTQAIDQEQYNSMMKQVMQLNETNKVKEAQKREAGGRKLKKTVTIESSFATTTAADLRRSERAAVPGVWEAEAAPWQQNSYINPLANALQNAAWSNPLSQFSALEVLQQQQLALAYKAKQTNILTIKIDNIPREIRFYDDIAIVFMDWDHPKEIGFQNGQRRITCDDKYSTVLSFNAANIPWTIDGVTHQIRLGCPTRELYIDNKWYECFFNEPTRVELNGVMRTVKIEGPPPQVRIGSLRTDLVVGKINLVIDGGRFMPVFLDGKEQLFEVDGQVHTLQFADYLLTVIINGVPEPVVFGELPKSYNLRGQKHFLRFQGLPSGVQPGKFFIRNMIRTTRHEDLVSPPPPSAATTAAAALAAATAENPSLQGASVVATAADTIAKDNEEIVNFHATPGLESLAPTSEEQQPEPEKKKQKTKKKEDEDKIAAPVLNNVNIDDLFQKLLASGILAGQTSSNTEKSSSKESSSSKSSRHDHHSDHSKSSRSSKEKAVKPVNLSRPETIKNRQSAIVHQLFSGMQCSSCGVRFPPEQTMKYSQHLDWHFRQNRRDRDSARKAHSRKWYYDVTDWIQYEEIEDLEEREKNWFETQQLEMDAGQEDSNQRGGADSPVPSCPALPDDSNKICEVCHDPFEQFYNEETEEWHLRPAIRVEERTYHPLCYADYQTSLTLSESKLDDTEEEPPVDEDVKMIDDDDDDDDEPVVVVKQEKPDEDVADKEKSLALNLISNGSAALPGLDAEDDDVIEVAPVEPTITEILDDEEEKVASPEKSPTKSSTSAQLEESDVEIQEPHIPIQDLDEIEDEVPNEVAEADDEAKPAEPLVVKIKEEPKDDGYNEDDAFMDVGTSFDPNEEMIIDEETLDERPVEVINGQDGEKADGAVDEEVSRGPEAPQMIATIDGNVEMQEAAAPAASTNKIRINISNSVVVGNKQQSSINSVSDSVRDGVQEPVAADLKPHELKATLQERTLKTTGRFANGYETSGLCSIM
ncbi:uncharacterized protein LOC132265822 [Phlebotomus argentipes]|uniref:uncharacterized protein LOC132265822 n=1 Tax=Phlebotomus argentipes TaxID=94469 RepID=UPI002892A105|nr:uncharacterized protein LOC132265822 [Phlebotomus argentipes]